MGRQPAGSRAGQRLVWRKARFHPSSSLAPVHCLLQIEKAGCTTGRSFDLGATADDVGDKGALNHRRHWLTSWPFMADPQLLAAVAAKGPLFTSWKGLRREEEGPAARGKQEPAVGA